MLNNSVLMDSCSPINVAIQGSYLSLQLCVLKRFEFSKVGLSQPSPSLYPSISSHVQYRLFCEVSAFTLFKALPPTQATSSLYGVLWQSHIQAYIMEYPPHGPCSFFSISFIMSCISLRRSGGCTSIFLINLLNKKHNIKSL